MAHLILLLSFALRYFLVYTCTAKNSLKVNSLCYIEGVHMLSYFKSY